MIAFAATPGQVAADGLGSHSVYTAALARVMGEPGRSLEDIFRQVRSRVHEQTEGRQTTWEYSSLLGDVYLEPETAGQGAVKPALSAPDKAEVAMLPAPVPAAVEPEAAAAPKPAAAPEPAVAIDPVSDRRVVAKRSNVRTGPGTSFSKLGLLEPGTPVAVTGRVRGTPWYRINSAALGEGFIHGALLASLPVAKAAERRKKVAQAAAPQAVARPLARETAAAEPQPSPVPLSPAPEVAAAASRVAAAPPVKIARYPTLETPESVRAGLDFPVQVWLSTERITEQVAITPGDLGQVTSDGQLEITLPQGDSWPLRVVLSAPGFDFAEGAAMAQIRLPHDGDSSVALFILRARDPGAAERRVKLRATLWHDGAYIASIAREITVLGAPAAVATRGSGASDNEEPVAPVEPLPAPPVQVITQKAGEPAPIIAGALQVPDLTVHVTYENPARLGRGQMILVSPHFGAAGQIQVVPFETPPETRDWLDQSFSRILDQTERAYRDAGTAGPTELMKARVTPLLQGFGRELYKKFVPEGFKEVFWALAKRKRLRSIQVFSNNPVLPWELIRPVSPDGEEEFDFLALDFRLARWHVGGERQLDKPLQSLALRELVTLAPHYRGKDLLPHQEAELAGLRGVEGYREVRGRFDDVSALMTRSPQGIVHFSGHGIVEQSAGGLAYYAIKLEDTVLDVLTWRGMAAAPGTQHPFYFFNSCDIGQAKSVANFVDGWAPAALEAGASGYIGAASGP